MKSEALLSIKSADVDYRFINFWAEYTPLSYSLVLFFCPLLQCPSVRLWNDKAAWAKMRQKILDSPMSELDVVVLEKELSKVSAVFFCVCLDVN